jgi:hypothetical protein
MESDVFPESDSWAFKNKTSDPDDDISRISVGQFMKSRSGALGSLDGDGPRVSALKVKTRGRCI